MSYDPETYWPARYQRQGETYVARGGKTDSYDRQLRAIRPYLAYLEGRVLDFGCGPGRFRVEIEDRGCEWEGVDLIDGLGTMDADEVEPASFDGACAIFVLQHLVDAADYRAALDLIHGGLKPGGKLLVVDHVIGNGFDEHMHPRGAGTIWEGWEWRGCTILGTWDEHWIGLFTK